jgi:FkbM family methyltransferase
VFEKIIAFYLNPISENIPLPAERKVFLELASEVYVDCGAFIGETVNEFIQSRGGVYNSIYCFEPDQISFDTLGKNLQQHIQHQSGSINLVNAAVGDSSKKVSFSHTGTWGSKVESADSKLDMVNQYALDDYAWTVTPTLIKFDIEGRELSALRGAKSFINNVSTVLSITAEHRIEDLWEIPLYLYSINPERLIYLVPQDFEVGMDLVYYSVPQQRAIV